MSVQSFTTSAAIVNGSVVLKDRAGMLRWASHVGDGVALVVEVKEQTSKRSLRANRAYWGLLVTPLAEHLGYDRHEIEDLHEGLLMLFAGTHTDKLTGRDVPNLRSSRMNTKQFAEFMEWTVRYAASEHGVVLELPNESEAA